MPELSETMYCSQQICIPPTFPYLLRQFAKAAIRTQPNDLLKWSTAYFRCLSLNIPPPVKPRLEYPIPKDFEGLTPGWLKALLFQLQNNETVDFRVLWDRWIGACLQHEHLIQVLCLGDFRDPKAIPWLKFIALCAGRLTENLTQTMIMICEILTEEPEGGSAMIPVSTFLELYEFLAKIDASKPQILRNYYFRDSYLGLYADRIAEDQGPKEEEAPVEEEQAAEEQSEVMPEEELGPEDQVSEISCPSVTAAEEPVDYLKMLEEHRKMQAEDAAEKGEQEGEDQDGGQEDLGMKSKESIPERQTSSVTKTKSKSQVKIAEQVESQTAAATPPADDVPSETQIPAEGVESREIEIGGASISGTEGLKKSEELFDIKPVEGPVTSSSTQQQQQQQQLQERKPSDFDSDKSEEGEDKDDAGKLEEVLLKEDLERLRAVQKEMFGESDDELEKFKASLIADLKMTPSQQDAVGHFTRKIDFQDESETDQSKEKSEVGSLSTESEEKPKYDEVPIDAIPGIGAIVPEELVTAVKKYMIDVSKYQHGVVMPRNIRHYSCPPLEVVDYNK